MPTVESKQHLSQKQTSSNLVLAKQVISKPVQLSHPIFCLQRMIGNKAVQRLLQEEIKSGKPAPAKTLATQMEGETRQIPWQTKSSINIQPIRTDIPGGNNHLMRQPHPQYSQSLDRQPLNPEQGSSNPHVLQNFATDSAELTAEHQAILQHIAADLNANPLFVWGGRITIYGFADRRGTDQHNLALSRRRANAVNARLNELLTDEGVRHSIQTIPLGEPQSGPIGDVPEFRKAIIIIHRPSQNFNLNPPRSLSGTEIPTETHQGRQPASYPERLGGSNLFRPIPPGWTRFLDPLPCAITRPWDPLCLSGQALLRWFLQRLSREEIDYIQELFRQLSRVLTERLGREQVARLVERIVRAITRNEEEARRARETVNDALVDGGVDLLNELFGFGSTGIAGPQTERPDNNVGPLLNEIPMPSTTTTPEIPW